MDTIRKIACWLAIVVVTLVKLPISIMAGLFGLAEAGLLRVNLDLAELLDCDLWTETVCEVMDWNIQKAYSLAESYEYLKEELE